MGEREARAGVRDLAERALLEEAPACAVINAEYEVLYIHGYTGRYLEPASREASLNLLRMAREGMTSHFPSGDQASAVTEDMDGRIGS